VKAALTIWLKELRESLREFHILVLSLGFPLLFYPLLMLGALQLQSLKDGTLEEEPPRVALDGPAELTPLLQQAGIEAVEMPPDGQIARAIEEGDLDLAILAEEEGQGLTLTLVHDGSSSRAKSSKSLVLPLLDQVRQQRLVALEEELGLPEGDLSPFPIEEINVSSDGQKMAAVLSMLVPMLLLVCMVMAGVYSAVELVVGERVRKTLETTMTAPVSRAAIMAGKIGTVVTLMLVAVLVNGGSMGLTLVHMATMLMDTPPPLELDHLALLGTLPLLISTALMAATILVLVALPTQSLKAGQNAVSTASLFLILPCMVGVVPGLELSPGFACIPLSSTALVLRDVLVGDGLSVLVWLSTAVHSAIAILGLWIAGRIAQSEHFLFGPSTGGMDRWRLILGRGHKGESP
jgi:sodium transport system permease protein